MNNGISNNKPVANNWNKWLTLYKKTDYAQPLLFLFIFLLTVFLINYFINTPFRWKKYVKKYVSIVTHSVYTYILIALFGITYYFYKNPDAITFVLDLVSHYPLYTTLFITTVIAFSICLYYFMSTKNSITYYWSGNMVFIMILTFILLFGLAFYYLVFVNANFFQRGWLGLIVQILSFLPCKIRDGIIWFLGEIKNTPRKVFFLLAIEILLIIWIFYYQSTLKWFSFGQKIFPIYNHSAYLIKETPITSYSRISKITGISNQTVPMNFGIAFWLYLNDNTQSVDTELPIFRYGGGVIDTSMNCAPTSPYSNQNVHPAITFIPTHSQVSNQKSENLWQGAGLTWNMGHLKVYFSQCSSGNENSMIIDVPLQRWNLLALNYTSQQADVFLNGEVVASHTFTEPPVYHLGDSIIVGGNELRGAIQDIQYSVLPFSKITVNAMYNNNLFINKVLPTFISR
jgi:hypothetical protein